MVEELHGHVAAEANHTRDAKLCSKRLDKIFLKLQGFLDRFQNICRLFGDVETIRDSCEMRIRVCSFYL